MFFEQQEVSRDWYAVPNEKIGRSKINTRPESLEERDSQDANSRTPWLIDIRARGRLHYEYIGRTSERAKDKREREGRVELYFLPRLITYRATRRYTVDWMEDGGSRVEVFC